MTKLNLSVLICATFLIAPAVAQAQDAKTTTPGGQSVGAFTAESVDPTKPFGEIDIAKAGATEDEVNTFYKALSPEQQTEIAGRCGVMLDPVQQERYSEATAIELCRNLVTFKLIPESQAAK